MQSPKMTYDREADPVYITFARGTFAYNTELDCRRLLDFDASGRLLGIEVLYLSLGVSMDGMPRAAEVAQLLQREGIRLEPAEPSRV